MKTILIAAAVVLLAACSVSNPLKPYKLDVQQGNVVTQDMIAKLRPGMSKSQVRFIMGSPLLVDIFHGNRWDYVYTFKKGGEVMEERRITLFFDGDLLQKVSGDVVAGSGEDLNPQPKPTYESVPQPEGAAPADGQNPDKAGAAKQTSPDDEEKGFFGRMLEKVGL
jgi:outer membrane protein assembly factor BamE